MNCNIGINSNIDYSFEIQKIDELFKQEERDGAIARLSLSAGKPMTGRRRTKH
ncbi:MAG: hypothetical protein LBV71_18950 [Prevotella sp.]|jgi:hypothetical protein|nr:hypothetical protein [Prevotella sp.]